MATAVFQMIMWRSIILLAGVNTMFTNMSDQHGSYPITPSFLINNARGSEITRMFKVQLYTVWIKYCTVMLC